MTAIIEPSGPQVAETSGPVPSRWQQFTYRMGRRLPDEFGPWVAADIRSDAYPYRQAAAIAAGYLLGGWLVIGPLTVLWLTTDRMQPAAILPQAAMAPILTVFVYVVTVNRSHDRGPALRRHRVHLDGSPWLNAPPTPGEWPTGRLRWWHYLGAAVVLVAVTAGSIAFAF